MPIALKDNLCTRGTVTTCGSKILEGWRPPYDATVVEVLRRAGAVALGKTNMDEFAMGELDREFGVRPHAQPAPRGQGPRRQQWRLGGSSRGRLRSAGPRLGHRGVDPPARRAVRRGRDEANLRARLALRAGGLRELLDQIGPFASSVEDAALLFDVVAGHDPRDSTSLSSLPEPTLTSVHGGTEGIRIGLCRDLVDGCAADVVARVHEAADALADAGAKVVEVSVPEFSYGLSAYYLIAPAEASSNLARYDGVRYGLRVDGEDAEAMNIATRTAGFGAEVKRRVMLGTYALSAGYYDAYYAQAQRVRTLVMQAFDRAYESVDVLLGATAPTTAFDLGAKIDDPMAMYMNDVCTIPSNLAGHPAVSVPFGTGDDGLPVGVQVLAPALGEATLFRVARVVEAHAPLGEAS